MQHEGFMVWVRPLPEDDGGGYVATVPDLPGCMADGETAEAALIAVQDAIDAWMEAAKAEGRSIPKPGNVEREFWAGIADVSSLDATLEASRAARGEWRDRQAHTKTAEASEGEAADERARAERDQRLRRKLKPLVAEALNKRDGREAGDDLPSVDEHTAGWLVGCGANPGKANKFDIADAVTEEIISNLSQVRDRGGMAAFYDECRERRDKFRQLRQDLRRAYRKLTKGGQVFPGKGEAVQALRTAYKVACAHEISAIKQAGESMVEQERQESSTDPDEGSMVNHERLSSIKKSRTDEGFRPPLGPDSQQIGRFYKKQIARTVSEVLRSHAVLIAKTKANETCNTSSVAIRIMNTVWSDANGRGAHDETWIKILGEIENPKPIDP